MKLTNGEKAAVRLLSGRSGDLSEHRRWMVLDAIFHRDGSGRMLHIEALADRLRRRDERRLVA